MTAIFNLGCLDTSEIFEIWYYGPDNTLMKKNIERINLTKNYVHM